MFSVVIPTLWKSTTFPELFKRYMESPLVDEIIIIDNNEAETPLDFSQFPKVVHVRPGKNIYVNPAWNLGVAMAKNENVLISNDDVVFSVDANLEFALKNLSDQSYKIIGVDPKSYSEHSANPEISKRHHIGKGWGCLLFLKKSNYKEIPHDLKIYFGDDWLALKAEGNLGSITFKDNVYTQMSTSSNDQKFSTIRNEDKTAWFGKHLR